MLKIERHNLIMELLKKKNFLKLSDLLKIMKISEATIRRDLTELEINKKLIRVHGGAKLISKKNFESDMSEKKKLHINEKNKIAKKGAEFLEDNQKIFLDAGTTTGALIPHILEKNNIEVVTNGYSHIEMLIKNGIKTFLIAGEVKKTTQALVGPLALLSLKNFNFDIAFLGANAITEEGYMTPDPDEAIVKEAILKKAERTYILADTSKFLADKSIIFAERNEAKLITEKGEEK
ncbi:MAG: transcription-repair coupling factor [Fusobacteriales bacterium]|nr:MAG: transcription-repair coupling factor [Fusobacteriales bacterium]